MGTELVFNQNGKLLTSSLLVAKTFGKAHDKVLRNIREISCSEGFRAANFGETTYNDAQGKTQPMYHLTRDGFTLLVMGYTGKKAMEFKEAYINAFNQMEQTLKNQTQTLSELEILARSAQALLEQSKRLEKVENNLDRIIQEQEENRQLLLRAELSEQTLPEETTREKIRKLVNAYNKATGVGFKEIWDSIYATMEYRFKIRVKAYKKLNTDKSYFDVATRLGYDDKIYMIISDMVKRFNKKSN